MTRPATSPGEGHGGGPGASLCRASDPPVAGGRTVHPGVSAMRCPVARTPSTAHNTTFMQSRIHCSLLRLPATHEERGPAVPRGSTLDGSVTFLYINI